MTSAFAVRPLAEPPDPDGSWPRRWLFETGAWMRAPWFAKDYQYAVRTASGVATAATVFKVIENPAEYDAHNLRDLFALTPPVFPEQSGVALARVAASPTPSDDLWFPNALVMFPGYVSTILTPSTDPTSATCNRTDLLNDLVQSARVDGLRAVGLPYVDAADGTLAVALKRAGFRATPMTSRSQLTVPPGGFDDGYLTQLSRRRAREIGRERRSLLARGVRTQRENLHEDNLEALLDLRIGLIRKYGHDVDREKESTRLAWLATLDGVHVFTARQEGQLLGFTLFLEHGSTWIAYMTGAEPNSDGRFVYFDTTFYAPLQWIYDNRHDVRTIDFGIGHNAAKRARGCTDQLLHGWIHAVDERLDRWLARTTGPVPGL